MSPSNPLAWQTALIDSEVDSILSVGGRGGGNPADNKAGERGEFSGGVGSGDPPQGQRREFLRRGAGRTSAGGNSCCKGTEGDGGAGGVGGEGVGINGATRRLEIVPGEVCPVCQEEMEGEEEGGGGGGGVAVLAAAAVVAEGRLTYCRDGCGNNMHAR